MNSQLGIIRDAGSHGVQTRGKSWAQKGKGLIDSR
jgi:hypothetical protein